MKESKVRVLQNLGWLDRVVRFIAGASVIAVLVYLIIVKPDTPVWYHYAILVATIPILTGIIGWCPLYNILGLRSCGGSGRNPCGTFPFEMDAALGHHPIPDSEIEHSLEHSHHERRGKAA
jgi:hypothetical protein